MKRRIGITTDCVCDLPKGLLKQCDIDIIYFYIKTERGQFRDGAEVTAANILEYLADGKKRSMTMAPPAEEFIEFFQTQLEKYEEVIHIAISDKISMCVQNSRIAAEKLGELGKRIHIVDSEHLSAGLGLMVLKAAEYRDEGCETEEILAQLEKMKSKVSTTFMAESADYLYQNGLVKKGVKIVCNAFHIHPVLVMRRGQIKLKSVRFGDYRRSVLRYVRKELYKKRIKCDKIFITHAGCSVSVVKMARKEIDRYLKFDSVMITKASATISSNSGMGTLGLLFEKE